MSVLEFRYDIGDTVIVSEIQRSARVDAVMVNIKGHEYRCVYWNDGERYSMWLYEWEVSNERL